METEEKDEAEAERARCRSADLAARSSSATPFLWVGQKLLESSLKGRFGLDSLASQVVRCVARKLRKQLRIGELLRAGRPGRVGPLLGRGLALVGEVPWRKCQRSDTGACGVTYLVSGISGRVSVAWPERARLDCGS